MNSDIELTSHPQDTSDRAHVEDSSPFLSPNTIVPRKAKDIDLEKNPTYFHVYFRSSHNSINSSRVTPAGLKYDSAQAFRHKDSLGRIWIGPEEDRCLSTTDGRLLPLVVQATEDVMYGPANSTWNRKHIKRSTPMLLRVLIRLMGGYLENGTLGSKTAMCLGWLPSCLMIALLLFIPADLGGEIRNGGRYDRFKYHFWGYAKVSANVSEAPRSEISLLAPPVERHSTIGTSHRLLRPRILCLLDENEEIHLINVEEWEAIHGSIEYIFICYTNEQFNSLDDLDELHRLAKAATRKAGLSAYWIACSCMPQEWLVEDVYRISDVARGAHSLVVIIGPQGTCVTPSEMLKQLGRRMWTFPEILLCPASRGITVYMRGSDLGTFRVLSRRNLAIEAWGDAPLSRYLVDHYESSIILSPLELVSIALHCIANRDTSFFSNGDLSYVLMGLLRRRPNVNEEDTEFEAFCRLSLANDSDQLIERLICLLPKNSKQTWHDTSDFWDSNLWDIKPHCQVVGLGGDDTIILGGAFGAPICWDEFRPINLRLRSSFTRTVAKSLLRTSPVLVLPGIILLAVQSKISLEGEINYFNILGWIFMGLYLAIMIGSPYFLYSLYVGKVWEAQPWLFGFEGYMEIAEIERLLLGVNLGRLRWSPYSSELSYHKAQRHQNQLDECVGVDPSEMSSVAETMNNARKSKYGEPKVFTLIDTNTLTVTLFRAARPPVAMLLCGSEGGMERALLCSYDWKSQTLYRENVIRVDTVVLEKMARVDRFRLGLETLRADRKVSRSI